MQGNSVKRKVSQGKWKNAYCILISINISTRARGKTPWKPSQIESKVDGLEKRKSPKAEGFPSNVMFSSLFAAKNSHRNIRKVFFPMLWNSKKIFLVKSQRTFEHFPPGLIPDRKNFSPKFFFRFPFYAHLFSSLPPQTNTNQ